MSLRKFIAPLPIRFPTSFQTFSSSNWKNFNPEKMLARLEENLPTNIKQSVIEDSRQIIKRYKDAFVKAGITDGYQSRWCLDPHDPECPLTAPNYQSKEVSAAPGSNSSDKLLQT